MDTQIGKKKAMDRQRDWSNLPPELLSTISNRLYSKITLLYFRAVCRSWRSSSIPIPSSNPLSLQIPLSGLSYEDLYDCDGDDEEELDNVRHVLLTESEFYFVQPLTAEVINISETFVIKEIQDMDFHSMYFVTLPFIYDDEFKFSLGQVTHEWRRDFNVVDSRISEIAKGFQLVCKDKDSNEFNYYSPIKVVASSSLSEVGDGFAVMAMVDSNGYYVWRFGDKNWRSFEFEDIVEIGFLKGKFYVVGFNGRTIAVDPKNSEIKIAAAKMSYKSSFQWHTVHLVEFHGDLYLIEKLKPYHCDGSIAFNIWKLDEEKKVWDAVKRKIHVLYVSTAATSSAQIF